MSADKLTREIKRGCQMKDLLSGVVVPIITPLKEDYTIDLEAMVEIGRHCLAQGAQSVFAFGTGGEGYGFSADTIASSTKVLAKAFPDELLIGVLQPSTNLAIEVIEKASAAGAHAFVAVPPYYMDDIEQPQIIEHYKQLSRYAGELVIYNIPGTTGINILPETILAIKQACPNVIGVKNSAAELDQFRKLMELTRDDSFHVMQGNCTYATEGLELGADGIVPVLGNISSRVYCDLIEAVKSRNPEEIGKAEEACRRVEAIEECSPGWMAAIKAAMTVLGLRGGIPLLPYRKASQEEYEKIEACVNEMPI